MTTLKVESKGGFNLATEIERIKQMAARANEVAVLEAASSLTHGQLDGPASGRIYKSRTGTGMHQASAPIGEQPHADTEDLIDHLEVDFALNRGLMPVASVGWDGVWAMRAAVLYDGSPNGRIAPRSGWHQAAQRGIEATAGFLDGHVMGVTANRFTENSGYQTAF